jgi:hypothetical protein
MSVSYSLFGTYEGKGLREDLIDLISNISPTETPMLTRFGKTKATAKYHEWQTDTLAAATMNKHLEGADTSTAALTPTVRTGNYTQISKKSWAVSETIEAVQKAGRSSEFTYQMAKHLKELARDMEYAILNGTGNSGGTGNVQREVKGVLSWLTTNVETGTGTGNEALTEGMYNDLLQKIFTQGGTPDVTYANGFQKRKISAFSTPSTRNIVADDKRLVATVDVYESDFGMQRIILNRYMPAAQVVALQEDMWKVAMLRPTKYKQLPDLGGGPRGQVEAEYTLVSMNEKASGKITGLTTS